MNDIVSLVIVSVSCWGVVETYWHGHLFDRVKEMAATRSGWIWDLLSCPFCLSRWAALVCSILVLLPTVSDVLTFVTRVTLLTFASSRLANLCNDLTHKYHRSPGSILGQMDTEGQS